MKHYKTIHDIDFKNYPQNDKDKALSAAFCSARDDLQVKRDLIIKHFKNLKF